MLLVLFLVLPGCGSGGAHNYHRVPIESEESVESEESLESEESEETEETEESLESEETEETEESIESEESEESEESVDVPWADVPVGGTFEFGTYPQGSDGEEDLVTWRVLQRTENDVLVISESGLDCKRYNETFAAVTWSNCTLRTWLNNDFINTVFTEEEQSSIKTSTLANNAGPSTTDRIFLLSLTEVNSLFADNADRVCDATAYAVKNGAYTYEGDAMWWLRSRGTTNNSTAAGVSSFGFVISSGYSVSDQLCCIRPALRLKL